MVDNVSNIEALDHSVNLTSEHVAGNFFALNKGLINNITYNSNFIIVSDFFIA